MVSRANARLALTAANALQKACRAYEAWRADPTTAKRARAERKQALYMRHRAAVIAAEAANPLKQSIDALVSLHLDPAIPSWARRRIWRIAQSLNGLSLGYR